MPFHEWHDLVPGIQRVASNYCGYAKIEPQLPPRLFLRVVDDGTSCVPNLAKSVICGEEVLQRTG